jgi:hypothetical protein
MDQNQIAGLFFMFSACCLYAWWQLTLIDDRNKKDKDDFDL